jgi:hypothetical protein
MKSFNGDKRFVKIDSSIIDYFLFKMNESELVNQKEYIIYLTSEKKDKLQNYYKGTFRGFHCILKQYVFINIVEIKTYPDRQTALLRFDLMFFPKEVYTFHNIEEVKENKKKAMQTMEKRSLDMILKRVVNEEFQWFKN